MPKWIITACNYEGDTGERYRARKVQLEKLIEEHSDAFLNEVSLPIKDKKASYNLSMLNKDLEGIKAAFANYIR